MEKAKKQLFNGHLNGQFDGHINGTRKVRVSNQQI